MMTQSEFALWCRRLALKPEAIDMIHKIRASPDFSQQSDRTIRCESPVELALISKLEGDSTVLEIYCQQSTFQVSYVSASGQLMRHPHTPDYFVIRRTSAGWIEARRQERLRTLAQEQPNRYRLERGTWVCPPGIAYANRLELKYTVHCAFGIGN